MQLEFDFTQQDLQTTSQAFFKNMYSILICMQIISNH
jgi:hypothetical protein